MHHVAVERGNVVMHRHQFAGAAGRAVEPADQFLPPRFGSKMQVAGILVGGLRAPGLDRLRNSLPVRTVVANQGLEERQPASVVEVMVAVKNLPRHRSARGLAAA